MSMKYTIRAAGISLAALVLANCASDTSRPQRQLSAQNQREIGFFSDKRKYGSASPRVVSHGGEVPKGGGRDHVGRPYTIAGRRYTPRDNPNYSATGNASWYGDAFHGRKTANGEVYDKNSYTAAHPTMPLPSYARVTNMTNGHSIIVRVNDRGPFHGGRIIDVSERVATALNFKHVGTARVRVDYVQRAALAGSDDRRLVATLQTNGAAATLPGGSTPVPAERPLMVASASPQSIPGISQPVSATPVAVAAQPARVAPPAQPAAEPVRAETTEAPETNDLVETAPRQRRDIPLPPQRPFDLDMIPGGGTPIQRVNNGQAVPAARPASQPAVAPRPAQPPRDRVAAVYFANPAAPVASMVSAPMARLSPGQFDRTTTFTASEASTMRLNAGLFRDRRNAERLAAVLAKHGRSDVTVMGQGDQQRFRVTASGFDDPQSASAALAAAKAAGATDATFAR
jgi:rare lipoprotein A